MRKGLKLKTEVLSICKEIYKAKLHHKDHITTSINVCVGTVLSIAKFGYIVNVNGENLEICW